MAAAKPLEEAEPDDDRLLAEGSAAYILIAVADVIAIWTEMLTGDVSGGEESFLFCPTGRDRHGVPRTGHVCTVLYDADFFTGSLWPFSAAVQEHY